MQRPRASKTAVFLVLVLLVACAAVSKAVAVGELETESVSQESGNGYVELMYLAGHLAEFENQTVTTVGTVRFYASIYMFEDFWLQAQNDAKILVVTRFAGLSVPSNGSLIEISGRIEHSALEGGFFFLNASSWTPANSLPEFPSGAALFLAVLLCSAVVMLLNGKLAERKA